MYLSAQTKCGSCSIHSHVTAAYHSYLFTVHDRCSGIGIKRLHQIASGQILIGREYTVAFSPGIPMNFGSPAPEPINTAWKLFIHQLIDGHGFTYHYVGFNMNTERFNILDLFCHNAALGKTELRDTVYQYTACLMQCLEDGDIITHFARSPAQVRPAGPEPMTATFLPFFCAAGVGLIPFSLAQSATKRSSLPMEMGSPLKPRYIFLHTGSPAGIHDRRQREVRWIR